MSERIYIVAGNMDEYRAYVFKKKAEYDRREEIFPIHTFVHSADHLRGLRDIKGFYIGSYEQRSDIDKIKFQIAVIKTKW